MIFNSANDVSLKISINIKQTYDQMVESENTVNGSCIDGYKNIIFLIGDNCLLCKYKFK